MTWDEQLARLREKEQDLFQRKQAAFAASQDARSRVDEAYNRMAEARRDLRQKREEMNSAFEAAKASSDENRRIWDEYKRIRETNSASIDAAKSSADYEHQQMVSCFESARQEYEYGDRGAAATLASEGHDHKERRNELNEEAKRLIQEIKDARSYAETYAPRVDWSLHKSLKAEYEQIKARKERLEGEFETLKHNCEGLKTEFDRLKAEHQTAKEATNRRKAELESEREKVLNKAGVGIFEREDAKIVKKSDGTTQVYHGGLGKGDGLGHGHTVLDQFGAVTYERKAFEERGSQNFKGSRAEKIAELKRKREERKRREAEQARAEDPALTSYGMRGNWGDLRHGWVNGEHPATWSEGIGPNAGQTLIRDGFVDDKSFHSAGKIEKNHDHYGPDVKFSNGNERIEDKGGYRGHYKGPGH